MANFKKEDKASMLARLDVLEKKMGVLEKKVEALEKLVVFEGVAGLSPASPAGNAVPTVSITPVAVIPEVKRKCQTNTCESMDTKEYQGKDRKMWLCDSHKF